MRPRTNLATHAEPGQTYNAGRIVRILRPKGANRGLRCQFICSVCGKRGTGRLVRITSGKQKSCRCLEREAWDKYHESKMATFSPEDRRSVVRRILLFGDTAASIAPQFRVRESVIHYVYRTEAADIVRHYGAAMSLQILREFNLPGSQTVFEIAQRTGLKREEVMVLAHYAKRQNRYAECEFDPIIKDEAMAARVRSEHDELPPSVLVRKRNGELGGTLAKAFAFFVHNGVPLYLRSHVDILRMKANCAFEARQSRYARWKREWRSKNGFRPRAEVDAILIPSFHFIATY